MCKTAILRIPASITATTRHDRTYDRRVQSCPVVVNRAQSCLKKVFPVVPSEMSLPIPALHGHFPRWQLAVAVKVQGNKPASHMDSCAAVTGRPT
jgi:hypothetical protein